MGLSIRAYARHRGCTHEAVRKALATGRIRRAADGTIDPAAADQDWAQATTPRPRPPAAGAVVDAETFQRARAAKMVAEARREELELRVREGDLIERAVVVREAFTFASQLREAWATWPSGIGAELAATLGVDAVVLTTLLEDAVRGHLELLADRTLRLPDPPAAAARAE
jgi:hypothetical protein